MALAFVLGGCEVREEGVSPRAQGRGGSEARNLPVQVIAHTFLPRLERENYWEPVRLVPNEPHFLLQVHPRLEVPNEGPWTLHVKNAAGEAISTIPGLRVDVATGAITLLCESSRFAPGDWTIELELEKDGLSSGPTNQVFRFRVESS